MKEKRTGLFENGLIWFGAALSIAEILTGTSFAALGFRRGLAAILLGHLIGGVLLFFAGLMGGRVRKSAMDCAKQSFGRRGAGLFALLNIVQLLGWTAIMIYDGALAAAGIFQSGIALWCVVIGALIALWVCVGIRDLGRVNTVAMAALFLMTLVLSFLIFRDRLPSGTAAEAMSFGAAVELAVAMPLSWLPLIADYTREAEKPAAATAVSTVTYSLVSCWMYVIGMGAALFTGESDIAAILLRAGLGIVGLLIVVFSTVTTTFLDAWSAAVSAESLWDKIGSRPFALVVTALGTLGAIFLPLGNITGFLYFIGSVFAPMIAILIADYFLLKRDRSAQSADWINLLVWLAGFLLYRLLMGVDFVLGSTLPDMLLTMLLCVLADKLRRKRG
ncbi:MAG: putative hydroxymethylpyrimidine transporter CytX [Oscillospiraceae bacterium]|nr:putative hydroxymethylpyrimidine transporter CytX [Oscillospiraceae bacterium]